ncbi:hypothetical protein JTB14_012743 [Gonioctena quinquepunctata]|nr:hypothetical protein JTB14_012743 [Gonioctena quinquepunctata]
MPNFYFVVSPFHLNPATDDSQFSPPETAVYNRYEYDGRNTFVIEPHTFGPGNYRIVLNVVEQDKNGIDGIGDILSDQCVFTIITDPLPIISVDAPNVPPKQNGSLNYEWSDVMKKSRTDSHNRTLENGMIIVSINYIGEYRLIYTFLRDWRV